MPIKKFIDYSLYSGFISNKKTKLLFAKNNNKIYLKILLLV